MPQFSFDITSEYDKAEINNMFMAVEREITNRYDFKGTPAQIEWLADKKGIKITGGSTWQCETILDIMRRKLASRNQSTKVLDTSATPHENNLKTTWDITFKQGLSQDNAKKITALLRAQTPKAKATIQAEAVRVASASKDELQKAMQAVTAADYDFPVHFGNYR